MTMIDKWELEPYQPNKGEMVVLSDTYHAGIRKTLNYVIGSQNLQAWIYIEDDRGPNFAIDVPPKEDMPEGQSVQWLLDHCMLFGPLVKGRGNIYSAPEG